MIAEILIDHGETANKCTIVPLFDRPDFKIISVDNSPQPWVFESNFLLHHEGECLSRYRDSNKKKQSIALVDCIWKRLNPLLSRIQKPLPTFVSIPREFKTAYLRKSENQSDPEGGLATIEALFIAQALLGNWDLTLLSKYYFAKNFLELNHENFLRYGISEITTSIEKLVPFIVNRNSRLRRANRGKKTIS